ncbi:MAG: RlmE family RNA methyltransferase [Alphaproteobacteria bacterium]|nr:RlmE family RNA methyltransferase [Alphaproteobacteria bacterium]MBV8334026.1 RlmE family RNA methyltransferase [Alphaproteobacteria bacterium]
MMRRPEPPGQRFPSIWVRNTRQRKPSSTRWLSRQLNDPYVAEAHRRGYRSRAAFKLIELDDRFRLLRPGQRVVDLGCAPGGWTQVAVERVGSNKGRGIVVGVDLAPTVALSGAVLLLGDLRDAAISVTLEDALGGAADVVLSDTAPAATGHASTDHLRIVALAEDAFDLASQILKPGGAFVAKVFQGGAEGALLASLKRGFAQLRHAKPPASRAESAETYVVATGFRG